MTWVWAIAALMAILYTVFSLTMYYTYRVATYDLGIFDQAIRSYARFRPGISIAKGLHNFGNPDFSVMGDHFSPIDALLAPLYWIYNSPVDLLMAQAVLFALAVPPIWAFTRRAFGGGRTGTAAAYCVSIAYALSWTLASAAAFNFHEVAFEPVLTAVAFERLQRGRLKTGLLAVSGLLLVKEDMGLYVAGLGLGLAVTRSLAIPRQRLVGLSMAGIGLAMTVIAVYVVIPAAGGRADYYWGYQALGGNAPQALGHIAAHPLSAAKLMITPRIKLRTMLELFAPFCFLSLLSPLTWAVFPLLLERMLSSKFEGWWQNTFQYNAYLIVPLALGAVDGALRLQRLARLAWRHTTRAGSELRRRLDLVTDRLPVAATVSFAGIAVAVAPHFQLGDMLHPSFYHRDATATAEAAVAARVPSGVVIETTNNIGPHLDTRATVEVWDGDGDSPLFPPWAIVNDTTAQFTFATVKEQKQRVALLRAHGYAVVFSDDGYILLRAPNVSAGATMTMENK